MKSKKEKTLIITLIDDEIDDFKEIVSRIEKENSRIGFNTATSLSVNQSKLLKELSKL